MTRAALAVFLLTALPVNAEQIRPDPSFFTGVYERVGRTGAEVPGLIDDLIRIAPAADVNAGPEDPPGVAGMVDDGVSSDWALDLFPCGEQIPDQGWPIRLAPSGYDEVPNLIDGKSGPFGFWCQYFTDHSNYPILTCQSDMGARFTLWPITDSRMAACMKAAGQAVP